MKNKSFVQLASIGMLLSLLTACSGSSGGGSSSVSPSTEPPAGTTAGTTSGSTGGTTVVFSGVAEIKQLDDENNQRHVNLGELDFGTRNIPDQILNPERIIQVRNSGDDILFFDMELRGQGEFTIVEEDCGMALLPHETCDVKIQLQGGSRRNGTVRSTLWFEADDNDMVIQLVGVLDIQGKDFNGDSNDDGDTVIDLKIDDTYELGFEGPVSRICVENDGDDPLDGLAFMISSAYEIYANNCPSVLQENDTCHLYVLYKDFTSLEYEDPLFGFLRAMSNMSDDYILSLTGGEVTSEPQ